MDELCALTQVDMPAAVGVCAVSGEPELSSEQCSQLSSFFWAFGLRLPSYPSIDEIEEMWRLLRYRYGQAVRLAARRMPIAENLLHPLSAQEIDYARAVGEQRQADAVKAARGLFVGQERVSFLR